MGKGKKKDEALVCQQCLGKGLVGEGKFALLCTACQGRGTVDESGEPVAVSPDDGEGGEGTGGEGNGTVPEEIDLAVATETETLLFVGEDPAVARQVLDDMDIDRLDGMPDLETALMKIVAGS